MAKIIHQNEHRAKKKAKNDFEKDFFKLINNSVFGKTIENFRKHRHIKHVITEKRRNYVVSEPNYQSIKLFTETLLAIEMRKTQIFVNKPASLSLSILELSKIVMYEFWFVYVKVKYDIKSKLCFILYIKTHDIYKDITEDVETRFYTSIYKLERPLPKGRNKKAIGSMKDKLSGKIMKQFAGLIAKT